MLLTSIANIINK